MHHQVRNGWFSRLVCQEKCRTSLPCRPALHYSDFGVFRWACRRDYIVSVIQRFLAGVPLSESCFSVYQCRCSPGISAANTLRCMYWKHLPATSIESLQTQDMPSSGAYHPVYSSGCSNPAPRSLSPAHHYPAAENAAE